MGRHSAPSSHSVNSKVAGAAAALLLVGVGGAIAVSKTGGADEPSTATASATATAGGPAATTGCSGPAVQVSAAPEMAPVLTSLTEAMEKRGGTGCVNYQVTPVVAGTQAQRLAETGSGRPQIWVPDSPLWVERVNSASRQKLTFGDTVATSPVVLAVPKTLADAGARTGKHSWAELFGGSTMRIAMADPQYSTASMLTLVSAQRAAHNPAQAALVQRAVIGLSRDPQDEKALMQQAALGAPAAAVFPASEQQIAAERAEATGQPASAITLADGAPDFAYGVVAVPPAAGGTAAPAAAVDALRKELTSAAGRKALAAAGFRVEGAEGPSVPGVVDVPVQPTAEASPSTAELTQALGAWNAVRRSMRTIVAIDVSGSMKSPAAANVSRIQLASGAAAKALKALPDQTQMGVWIFSTDRGPNGQAWAQASPLVTLGDKTANGVTERDKLLKLAASFPSLPKGDTGLYATISAAVKQVQNGYDPQRVNSVVLMTDGVNDDPKGAMTKEALLAELRAEAAGKTPVRVVLVGMGDKTDMATLREIATASGGSAYNATEPDAMENVIVGALTRRMQQVTTK